jgi:hypothetical protein
MIRNRLPSGEVRCTLKDAVPPPSAKARELGANAVIIDNSLTMKTSLTSTGISVQARAVRIAGQ